MPGNNGNKALLERGIALIREQQDRQRKLSALARELGEVNLEELRKTRVKRFQLGTAVLVLEYRPNARNPERRWNLSLEAIDEAVG